MAFLSKFPRLSNSQAVMVIFAAWYLSAAVTTLIVQHLYNHVIPITFWTFLLVLGSMSLMFVVSQVLRRTDLVDMAWGLSFIVAAIGSFLLNDYALTIGFNVQTLTTLLVIIWGGRLAYIIFLRLKSRPEDKRYIELRKKWKGSVGLNTFLRIYVLQAVLATIISIGVIHINLSLPTTFSQFSVIGVLIWLIGFFFEAVGDYQLKQFLKDPTNKGKIMARGLWRYTRHPNYFGEATMWWGIFVIALGTPYGWVAVITPVTITYLLLFVSGVPLTEKSFEGKPGWDIYKRRVSKFFPMLPQR
jgi:steroid 5-alpha reductase family enzyme